MHGLLTSSCHLLRGLIPALCPSTPLTNGTTKYPEISDRGSCRIPSEQPGWNPEKRDRLELRVGRVCGRRRVTSLALSVARWVHNSAHSRVFRSSPIMPDG